MGTAGALSAYKDRLTITSFALSGNLADASVYSTLIRTSLPVIKPSLRYYSFELFKQFESKLKSLERKFYLVFTLCFGLFSL